MVLFMTLAGVLTGGSKLELRWLLIDRFSSVKAGSFALLVVLLPEKSGFNRSGSPISETVYCVFLSFASSDRLLLFELYVLVRFFWLPSDLLFYSRAFFTGDVNLLSEALWRMVLCADDHASSHGCFFFIYSILLE